MMKTVSLVLIAAGVALSGCDLSMSDSKQGDDTGVHGNPKTYRKSLVEQAGLSDAPFSILDVKYASPEKLEVTVLHPLDCQGDFDFFWDGSVALSSPPQVYLVMKYKGTCPTGALSEKTTVTLDLKDLLGSNLDVNPIVHVINGSVTHSSNDKNARSK